MYIFVWNYEILVWNNAYLVCNYAYLVWTYAFMFEIIYYVFIKMVSHLKLFTSWCVPNNQVLYLLYLAIYIFSSKVSVTRGRFSRSSKLKNYRLLTQNDREMNDRIDTLKYLKSKIQLQYHKILQNLFWSKYIMSEHLFWTPCKIYCSLWLYCLKFFQFQSPVFC